MTATLDVFYPPPSRRLLVKRRRHGILRSAGAPKPVVLVDTRERQPWPLCADHGNWIGGEKRAKLDGGDYSIEGMMDVLALERKSLPDLVACTIARRRRAVKVRTTREVPMMRRLVLIVLAACLPAVARADEADHKAIEDRLARLEKLVVRDPFRPDETVLARLEAIEEKLEKQAKAEALAQRQSQQDERHLQRLLETMQKDLKSLDGRVNAVERSQKSGADSELRALKRDLETLQRSLRDLSDRVARLERAR